MKMTKGTTVKITEDVVEEPEEEVKEDTTTTLELDEELIAEDDEQDMYAGAKLADFPDEEELWPDGPNVGQAKAWKAAYGRIVAGTLESGEHYIIRPINRAEYRNHAIAIERSRMQAGGGLQTAETLATEEAITLIGLVYPEINEQELRNFGPAGFPTLVSQQIMEISDFVAVETTELI
jgi:hypothetical protein